MALKVDTSKKIDGMFAAMFEHAKKEIGDQFVFGANASQIAVGLPFPALSLEYLTYCTCWPLSRIATLVGLPGSGKTALGFEISRWHHLYGGGSIYADCEHKDASHVRTGMYRHNPLLLNRTATIPCYVLDDAQSAITKSMDLAVEWAASQKLERQVPMAYLLDSLMGNVPEKEAEAVMKNEGAADRGHPLSALMIARWSRFIGKKLEQNPFSLLATNHLRIGTDQKGYPTRTTPGGTSVPFLETTELELKKMKDIDTLERTGMEVKIKAHKNCVGPGGRSIVVDFIWWWEHVKDVEGNDIHDEHGVSLRQQHFGWDWNAATITLMRTIQTEQATRFTAICNDACDFNFVGNSQRGNNARVWSDALGIPEDDPQTYALAGKAIQERPDILSKLRYHLDIMPMHVFQAGQDYKNMLAESQAAAKAQVEAAAPAAMEMPIST